MMTSLEKIADILNIKYDDENTNTFSVLNRVMTKVGDVDENSDDFRERVLYAFNEVEDENEKVMPSMVTALTAEPAVKELKIKSSPKGARIKVAAANGIKYSFGPVWNKSVLAGKGIALVPGNRAKLNHQALMAQIQSPESMDVKDLCKQISVTLV